MKGYAWQEMLGHRVELADPPSGSVGTAGVWDLSRWDEGTWGEGWAPTFRDITPDVLHVHSTTGALGLDLAAGVGTIEVELLDLAGQYTPESEVEGLLGRHLRGWVTPYGREETPAFYGIVDKAGAGGTFTLPTVELTAYDVRSIVAAAAVTAPVANQAEPAATRIRNILTAAQFPASAMVIEDDSTTLLADETVELGDLLDRTIESTAGLCWADAQGRIVTRNRFWVVGTADHVSAFIYAGEPPYGPDDDDPTPVAQTTGDLTATQATETVANFVTYANRNDPVESVTVSDPESMGRYGIRKLETTDLASDLPLLEVLAARALELRKAPALLCEGATVTVYDPDTAAAAALALGDMVYLGRNDPGVATWEILGVVAGVELTIDPDRFDVAITVLEGGAVIGAAAKWDMASWDIGRWAPPAVLTQVWTMGPAGTTDQLDAGNIMGGATLTLGPHPADRLDQGNVLK